MFNFAFIAFSLFSNQAEARELAVWRFKSNASIKEQQAQFDEIVREAARNKLSNRDISVLSQEKMRQGLTALNLNGDCLDHPCTIARAKAIGAEWILKGEVVVDGKNWGIEISLYDTKSGQRIGKETIQNASYAAALVSLMEKTKSLLGELPEGHETPHGPLISEIKSPKSDKVNPSNALKDSTENKALREALLIGTWTALRDHIAAFPDGEKTKIARDALLKRIAETRDLRAIVDVYPLFKSPTIPNHKLAMFLLHEIFTDDLELKTLRKFYETFKAKELQQYRKKDYMLARMLDEMRSKEDRIAFINMAAPHQRAVYELQNLIRADLRANNVKQALETVESFAAEFEELPDYIELKELLSTAEDVEIDLKTIQSGKQSKRGMSFFPVPTADGSKLYFTGKRRKDSLGGEDIYVIDKEGEDWSNARLARSLSSKEDNDAVLSISTDGNTMLVFNNGIIYSRDRTGNDWGKLVNAGETLNGAGWQSDAVLSSDGKTILFSSPRNDAQNMPRMVGNENSPGWVTLRDPNKDVVQADLYVSHRDDNGEWGEPINMGPQINTPYFERSPFLHPDMKTLYFSSDGHGGLGGLDVWMSKRLDDDCWDCWSPPINMGKEINGPDHDMGYKISTNGKIAYFSKADNKGEGIDLFSLILPPRLRPDLVSQLSGSLMGRNNQPISATIRWEDLDTGELIGESKSNPEDGSYFIVLPMGKMYGYYVDDSQLFPTAKSIDLRDEKKSVNKVEKIEVVTIKEMVDEGIAAPLNNLFFESNRFELLGFSKNELKRVAKIIKSNNLSVEIGGHTDDLGPKAKNKELSMQRALSVRDFLVEMGVSSEQLFPVGYGEEKPVVPNDSAENRGKNRRVELSFLNDKQIKAAKDRQQKNPLPARVKQTPKPPETKPKPPETKPKINPEPTPIATPKSNSTPKLKPQPTPSKTAQSKGKLPINTILKMKSTYRYGYIISGYKDNGQPIFVFYLNGKARPDKKMTTAMTKEAKALWRKRVGN